MKSKSVVDKVADRLGDSAVQGHASGKAKINEAAHLRQETTEYRKQAMPLLAQQAEDKAGRLETSDKHEQAKAKSSAETAVAARQMFSNLAQALFKDRQTW